MMFQPLCEDWGCGTPADVRIQAVERTTRRIVWKHDFCRNCAGAEINKTTYDYAITAIHNPALAREVARSSDVGGEGVA